MASINKTPTDAQRKTSAQRLQEAAAENGVSVAAFTAPEGTPMIYPLIGKAMAEIGAIGKDQVNEQQRYKFRGIDAVYNALNPVMGKYGLFITPEILEQKREERTNRNGTALIYSIITMRYTVYAPDGSFIQTTVIGEGMDSGDKATNKAMSIAMKYAMFQLFMIPTEDLKDPDAETHEVMGKQQPLKVSAAEVAKAVNSATRTTVTTAPKLPENKPEPKQEAAPDTTTVKGYLQNEIAFMSGLFEISDKREMGAKFESMRKELVKAGVIPDIESSKLTMEQAKNLIEAIYNNFLTDKRDQE